MIQKSFVAEKYRKRHMILFEGVCSCPPQGSSWFGKVQRKMHSVNLSNDWVLIRLLFLD